MLGDHVYIVSVGKKGRGVVLGVFAKEADAFEFAQSLDTYAQSWVEEYEVHTYA